jgi:hypothetical protein
MFICLKCYAAKVYVLTYCTNKNNLRCPGYTRPLIVPVCRMFVGKMMSIENGQDEKMEFGHVASM